MVTQLGESLGTPLGGELGLLEGNALGFPGGPLDMEELGDPLEIGRAHV